MVADLVAQGSDRYVGKSNLGIAKYYSREMYAPPGDKLKEALIKGIRRVASARI